MSHSTRFALTGNFHYFTGYVWHIPELFVYNKSDMLTVILFDQFLHPPPPQSTVRECMCVWGGVCMWVNVWECACMWMCVHVCVCAPDGTAHFFFFHFYTGSDAMSDRPHQSYQTGEPSPAARVVVLDSDNTSAQWASKRTGGPEETTSQRTKLCYWLEKAARNASAKILQRNHNSRRQLRKRCQSKLNRVLKQLYFLDCRLKGDTKQRGKLSRKLRKFANLTICRFHPDITTVVDWA